MVKGFDAGEALGGGLGDRRQAWDFIRDLADAGYHNVPVEKLVSMRIHGVDAEFIRKAK